MRSAAPLSIRQTPMMDANAMTQAIFPAVTPNSVIVNSMAVTNVLLPSTTARLFDRTPTATAETISATKGWTRSPAMSATTTTIPTAKTRKGQKPVASGFEIAVEMRLEEHFDPGLVNGHATGRLQEGWASSSRP